MAKNNPKKSPEGQPGAEGKDKLGRPRRGPQNLGVKVPQKGDGGKGMRCPGWLGSIGKTAWRNAKKQMAKQGILDSADAPALELYAAAYEELRMHRRDVMKNGARLEGVSERGYPTERPNPAVSAANAAATRARALFACLGIGVNYRAALGGSDPDEVDEFNQLYNS